MATPHGKISPPFPYKKSTKLKKVSLPPSSLTRISSSSFLHASPIVSFYQMAVPFVIWTNRDYRTAHPSENSMLTRNESAEVSPARDLFHTMLGAAGIRTTSYTPSHSLTDTLYHPSPRLFLNDRNEPCNLHQLHLTPHDFQLMRTFGITY